MIEILQKAQKGHYAIGQFNASNLEQIKAINQAAQKLKAAIIIATSEGEAKFVGLNQVRALVDVFKKEAGIPIILHFDHGKSLESVKKAIEAGYDSVHFDGSGLDFKENVEISKKVVEHAKDKAVIVEGELGYLRGKSAIHEEVEIKEEDLTDPDLAREFVEKTGVDSLAVAIGNIHGISAKAPHLYFERLKAIREKTNAFLVLHGGSGIAPGDIQKAIKLGIVKININTELRVAYTDVLKKSLRDNPQETTPYKIMPPVVKAVREVVEGKIRLFRGD